MKIGQEVFFWTGDFPQNFTIESGKLIVNIDDEQLHGKVVVSVGEGFYTEYLVMEYQNVFESEKEAYKAAKTVLVDIAEHLEYLESDENE